MPDHEVQECLYRQLSSIKAFRQWYHLLLCWHGLKCSLSGDDGGWEVIDEALNIVDFIFNCLCLPERHIQLWSNRD